MLYNEEQIRARYERRKKERTRQLLIRAGICIGVVLVVLIIVLIFVKSISSDKATEKQNTEDAILLHKYIDQQPTLDVQLLDVNKYSRPGLQLEKVNGIVVHYTANPGTTAQQNRDYFQGLAQSGKTYASSHFVIGLEGEIVQCIPCSEISYASNDRNNDTISIECCIEDETGKFNSKTYDSLIRLTTWLMGRYELRTADVIRHYDVTGKACPKYFVDHEDSWEQFHKDLIDYIEKNGVDKP
ncbi:MAG: peptidoglycan recognition family protein [Agathobacter sp.]|nr:peptidoglycan recognition family protein [Agathobacter sp.]